MSEERIEITLRDVYSEQRHTTEQLTSIGTQLATLTTRVDARLDTGQHRLDDHEQRMRVVEAHPENAGVVTDHENRVRALERFRFTLMGAAAAFGALSASLTLLIEYALTHH